MRKSWQVSDRSARRGRLAAAGLLRCRSCCCLPRTRRRSSAPGSRRSAGSAGAARRAPPQKPGVFEAIGRWFDRGRDQLPRPPARRQAQDGRSGRRGRRQQPRLSDQAAKVGKGAVEAGKGAADATKNAVDAVAKLPAARMIEGRERCVIAPNGAPDCLAAAEALCRKHGFASGKSMDFTSAEECPAKHPARPDRRSSAATVTFISRAMCQ